MLSSVKRFFWVNITEFCVISCGSGMTLPIAAQPLKWQTSHIPNDMRISLVLGDNILSYGIGRLITWPKNKARFINTSRGFMLIWLARCVRTFAQRFEWSPSSKFLCIGVVWEGDKSYLFIFSLKHLN